MFKNSVSTENDELIKTETRIKLVNEKIDFYKSFLLDSEKRSSKIRENCFYIPQGCKIFTIISNIYISLLFFCY